MTIPVPEVLKARVRKTMNLLNLRMIGESCVNNLVLHCRPGSLFIRCAVPGTLALDAKNPDLSESKNLIEAAVDCPVVSITYLIY